MLNTGGLLLPFGDDRSELQLNRYGYLYINTKKEEKEMIRKEQRLMLAIVMALFCVLFAGTTMAADKVFIKGVDVDLELLSLTIHGTGFDTVHDTTVTLGTFGELDITSETSTEITATLPAGISPGSYLLRVMVPKGATLTDEFDLYIPSIPFSPLVYAIGDVGPAGGWVFYVDEDGLHGLEAAPEDQSGGVRWWNGTYTNTEALGNGVGAGEMNTMLIIANQGHYSNSYAAGICANLVITNAGVDYGDWYLPSEYELNLMYTKLYLAGVGHFYEWGYYWSSTEHDINHAYYRSFRDGTEGFDAKQSDETRVRAARAF
jgi:hypothetical protein